MRASNNKPGDGESRIPTLTKNNVVYTKIRTKPKYLRTITKIFILVRLFQFVLVYLTPNKQFDTSTAILLNELNLDSSYWINKNVLNKLLSWDSTFFIKNIINSGNPVYENEYAFSPLWCKFLRAVLSWSGSNINDDPFLLLKLTILANFVQYLSAISLYYLTLNVFKNTNMKFHDLNNLAFKSSLLYVVSSSAGFALTFYSEGLSALFTFLGLIFRSVYVINYNNGMLGIHTWWDGLKYSIITPLLFGVAVINRPNCILLGYIYISDLMKLISAKYLTTGNLTNNDNKHAFIYPLVGGFILFMIFIKEMYYTPYVTFCSNIDKNSNSSWCSTSITSYLPFITKTNLYSYIQSEYWNVGLFKYWTLNNIPNFLFAIPNTVLCVCACNYFEKKHVVKALQPLIHITKLFLLVVWFVAHTQIINRIINFIPLHLWYIASVLSTKTRFSASENVLEYDPIKIDKYIITIYLYWLILWFPCQTVLFSAFLPPA
ncbi:related to GPI mannosyltransferase 2 [Saccharomycodes ludwigii]|uniref:GPI mannosyltransferase 2 n=1 Tax=Saccharomycodes ludwigii TaxID=36035 RepID=A0A376BBF3_9ASCO|nr:hypothetical protein SCDLUD_002532 [Saccharomycodes ludwigii]KAH3901058.1 hypothetical protein SCDLUD_002532 [Saccharomycodes ludwigii]SSD61909.1 related to GPI mannosyltransferase 2 [Saccharomycodes ludwigii]